MLRDLSRVRRPGPSASIEGEPPRDGFRYTSDNNDRWLDVDELREMAAGVTPSVDSDTFLPYGRQEITEADVAAVTAALREPLITQGPPSPSSNARSASAPVPHASPSRRGRPRCTAPRSRPVGPGRRGPRPAYHLRRLGQLRSLPRAPTRASSTSTRRPGTSMSPRPRRARSADQASWPLASPACRSTSTADACRRRRRSSRTPATRSAAIATVARSVAREEPT